MLVQAIVLAAAAAVAIPPAYAQNNKSKRTAVYKQRHQCKVGPYEKQTRLVMETVRNKPVYLAYWSSNGPYHCSFESWPGDGRATWTNSKTGTVIKLLSGSMRIVRNGDKYFIHAREVDRQPYCGTLGFINGVLTLPVRKGNCRWEEQAFDEDAARARRDADAPPTYEAPISPAAPSDAT